MVKEFVVEYTFCNLFGEKIKRKRYPGNALGAKESAKKFRTVKEYIEWCQSEDYEKVSLYIVTYQKEEMFYISWDTLFGWKFSSLAEVTLKWIRIEN